LTAGVTASAGAPPSAASPKSTADSDSFANRSLPQWLIRRVEFRFEGTRWPVIFTHKALLICEELTGEDMLNKEIGRPSALMLRALIFSALTAAGAKCSLGAVGDHIPFSRLEATQKCVLDAWLASMPDPEKPPRSSVQDQEAAVPATEAQKLTWLEAYAVAREYHKLSDQEWLDMTPRQFRALQKFRLHEMQRQELMVGILAATTQNFSACHPKQPVTPESFMLHKFTEKEPEPVTGELIMEVVAKSFGKMK
jgi:hypothetical protein